MDINIKLSLDAPQGWKRRVLLYVGTPLALVASASAMAYAYDTLWIEDGKVVSASALKANLDEIQTRLNALEPTTDCPVGYTRDASAAAIVLCKKGADEVVKVGNGAAAFWIDRYEASVWSDAAGMTTQYGAAGDDFPATFPHNGQVTAVTNLLYAVSKTSVSPSTLITWFQANLACLASGKRLPTDSEWQLAATGTNDPGANNGANGACLTAAAGKRNTGAPMANIACASVWGAQDMIGNVWEWMNEWVAAPGAAPNGIPTMWPTSDSNGDGLWNVTSGAFFSSMSQSGIPAAAIRGGGHGEGTAAGVFAISVDAAPSFGALHIGFRCVVPK